MRAGNLSFPAAQSLWAYAEKALRSCRWLDALGSLGYGQQEAEEEAREALNPDRIRVPAARPQNALHRQAYRDRVRIADVGKVLYFHETREKERLVRREAQHRSFDRDEEQDHGTHCEDAT